MDRLSIEWTQTAKAALAKLPHKVRRGLLDKANELKQATDPTTVHKRLAGPLSGYHRICYSRYRAIYCVDRQKLTGGAVIESIRILFVAAGVRKEGDKNDVYRFAQRLIKLGVIKTRN
jgi:mRNA interferase RelE/StbE